MFRVQKRDGSIEDFNRRKVVIGLVHSGATSAEAERLASDVENALRNMTASGFVKSQDIRTKVLEGLKVISPEVCKSFEFYRKPNQ